MAQDNLGTVRPHVNSLDDPQSPAIALLAELVALNRQQVRYQKQQAEYLARLAKKRQFRDPPMVRMAKTLDFDAQLKATVSANPELNQKSLAILLGVSESKISRYLKRMDFGAPIRPKGYDHAVSDDDE